MPPPPPSPVGRASTRTSRPVPRLAADKLPTGTLQYSLVLSLFLHHSSSFSRFSPLRCAARTRNGRKQRLRPRNRALMPGHCRYHCCCLCLYLCFCRFLVPWRISLPSVSLLGLPAVLSSLSVALRAGETLRWCSSHDLPPFPLSFSLALSTTRPLLGPEFLSTDKPDARSLRNACVSRDLAFFVSKVASSTD